MRLLIVYPDSESEYYDYLRESIEERYKSGDLNIVAERNLKWAKNQLTAENTYDFIVSHICFPEEPGSVAHSSAALELDKWLDLNHDETPMAIIVPRWTNEIAASVVRAKHTRLFQLDDDLVDPVLKFAENLSPSEMSLDIVLSLRESKCGYQIKGENFRINVDSIGELEIGEVGVNNLKLMSNLVDEAHDMNAWTKCLSSLCENLDHHFIRTNHQFRMDLEYALRELDNIEHANVRYVVDKYLYPVLFEAAPTPALNHNFQGLGKYWIEHGPLIRYVSKNREGAALFRADDNRPISMLIICSDAYGHIYLEGDVEYCLKELDMVSVECEKLEAGLNKLKDSGLNLGEIRLLRSSSDVPLTEAVVKGVLGEKEWGIIHYAGHSHYDERSGMSYVFFDDDDRNIRPVQVKDFAQYMQSVKLLILSSCSSANKNLVFELARHQVPAVLGYRTQVDDAVAHQFALDFFEELFRLWSVEGAFCQARKKLYNSTTYVPPAWTSPVLVLESVDCR